MPVVPRPRGVRRCQTGVMSSTLQLQPPVPERRSVTLTGTSPLLVERQQANLTVAGAKLEQAEAAVVRADPSTQRCGLDTEIGPSREAQMTRASPRLRYRAPRSARLNAQLAR